MLKKIENLSASFLEKFNHPPIKISVPQEFTSYLGEFCDDKTEKIENFQKGGIYKINTNLDKVFLEFLYDATRTLVWNLIYESSKKMDLRLASINYLSLHEGDFLPLKPSIGLVSGICFFKVSNSLNLNKLEGCMAISSGDIATTLKPHNLLNIKPEIGDVYIYPSYFSKIIYPFYGSGETKALCFSFINKTALIG